MFMKLRLDGHSVDSLSWDLAGEGGFFHGSRVMTTMQIIGQRFVDFDRHVERLTADAEMLGIHDAPSKDIWKFDIQALIDNNSQAHRFRARLLLFRDALGQTHRLATTQVLSVRQGDAMNAVRLAPVVDKGWNRGAQIKTGLVGRRDAEIARSRSQGFDDVLWVNGEQEVAEATWANVFLLGRTGDLLEIATPPESSGILPGITRARVIDLLNSSGIPVTIRPITIDEIPRFDEAFLTSSIQGLVPVTTIGRHVLPTLRPSAVFRHIHHLYETWLSLDNDYVQGASQQPILS